LSEGLLAALPGYKGPDVYSRGADPEIYDAQTQWPDDFTPPPPLRWDPDR
jgi:hypothetical protein